VAAKRPAALPINLSENLKLKSKAGRERSIVVAEVRPGGGSGSAATPSPSPAPRTWQPPSPRAAAREFKVLGKGSVLSVQVAARK
jgi:hypothetical protein